MNNSTKKWIITKISSLALIPLMIWFIINFVKIYDNDYQQIISFFSSLPSKLLFSIFIVISYLFFTLTISEIFEDYLHDAKIKNVANKLLNFFAIIVSIFVIIGTLKI